MKTEAEIRAWLLDIEIQCAEWQRELDAGDMDVEDYNLNMFEADSAIRVLRCVLGER